MCKLMWRKGLGVLRWYAEWIKILEVVVGSNSMRVEALEVTWLRILTSMDPRFRGW